MSSGFMLLLCDRIGCAGFCSSLALRLCWKLLLRHPGMVWWLALSVMRSERRGVGVQSFGRRFWCLPTSHADAAALAALLVNWLTGKR